MTEITLHDPSSLRRQGSSLSAKCEIEASWIPAFAGMTVGGVFELEVLI
jgi:hypothetical protein